MDEPKVNVLLETPARRSRVWVGWLVLVVVLAVVGGLIYWYGFRSSLTDTAGTVSTTTTEKKPATTTPTDTKIADKGVTWLTSRAVLADPGILQANGSIPEGLTLPVFYTVAKTDDGGTLVLASVSGDGPMPVANLLLKKTAAGKWLLYTRYSDSLTDYPYYTAKEVTSSDTDLPSLDVPSRFKVGTNTLVTEVDVFMGADLLQSNPNADSVVKKLADTPYGDLLAMIDSPNTADGTSIQGQALRIARNDNRYTQLKVELPFLRDDKTVDIKTTDGTTIGGNFLDEGQGCGRTSTTTIITDPTVIKDKVAVGTAPDGSTVYTLHGADNQILKTLYASYHDTRDYPGTTETIVTFDAYRQSTPVLLWQDGFGQWIMLQNDAYAMLAECGKPVVYLYPTTTTPVTVKVGANITKSDPMYKNGWSGVATPDSQITVNGQTYPYLFWEGHGQGVYPDTKVVGTVVAQKDLRTTLDRQLGALGLTAREQADFKEFWLLRLPRDPYVRLTWLTTGSMNQIAPLTVTPTPDTIIRVFLDFQGMSAPVAVRPQTLHAVPRVGFTVVEWGGLLR